MNFKINIYTANHGKVEGIEDYIKNLHYIFESRGFEVKNSRGLNENAINIVIDEFTNFPSNLFIKEFRARHPETPIILVATEFVERKYFVSSFNHFGSIFESAFLSWIDLGLRNKRTDFIKSSPTQWLKSIALLPIIPLYIIKLAFSIQSLKSMLKRSDSWLQGLKRGTHQQIYMHMRYLGFQSMIECADAIIMSHDLIRPGIVPFAEKNNVPVIGTFFPECSDDTCKEEMLKGKDLCIEISGSVTLYRSRQLRKIARDTTIFGMHHQFKAPRKRSFGDNANGARAAFSLHPPQTKTWKYASPTRIYRALFVDKNIPVITKNFKQHPIEEACLNYDGGMTLLKMCQLYEKPEMLKEYINANVKPYLAIASKNNNALLKKLMSLPAVDSFHKNSGLQP